LGVKVGESELVFLAEAAWMFVYVASDVGGSTVFRKYDRDFGTSYIIGNLEDILNSWWALAIAEL
jgi:hypothetical protein